MHRTIKYFKNPDEANVFHFIRIITTRDTYYVYMKIFTTIVTAAAMLTGAYAYAFQYEGINYNILDDNSVAIGDNRYAEGEIVIPETVTDPSTQKVYTVTQVAKQAFGYAEISSITLPNSITFIDRVAFSDSKIKSISLPENLEIIGYNAFSHCLNLESIEIPNSVTVLGELSPLTGYSGSVFFGCSSLKQVKLPDNLDMIDDITFKDCTSLETLELPSTITSIGNQAFAGCTSLKSITLPAGCHTIKESAFSNCNSLETVNIPEGVTEISHSTFLWCYALKSIDIPNTVTTINKQSFALTGLTEINTPNSVEHIASGAFGACADVKTITLGSGVRRIGSGALQVWSVDINNVPYWALTDIYCQSTVPPVYYHEILITEPPHDFFFNDDFPEEMKDVFYSQVTLHVPDEAVDDYKAADQWCMFKNINGLSGAGSAIIPDSGISFDGSVITADNEGIAVYSAFGSQVVSTTGNELDMDRLPAGIYIVKAGDSVKKIVKR